MEKFHPVHESKEQADKREAVRRILTEKTRELFEKAGVEKEVKRKPGQKYDISL